MGFEALRIGLEGAAAADQHRLERIEGGQGAVGDWLVDEGPPPCGRLQFRRVRGQQHHVDAFWQHQIVGDVPAGLVDHQHGTVVARWGASTVMRDGLGNFIAPHAIAVDSTGAVYVCEVTGTFGVKPGRVPDSMAGHQLQKFTRAG